MESFLNGFYTIVGGLLAIPVGIIIAATSFYGVCWLLGKMMGKNE